MLHVLYLAHDLSDSAVRRRVLAFEAGGAKVTLAGFRRGTRALPYAADKQPIKLGVTKDARFAQRTGAVAKAWLQLGGSLGNVTRPDVIVARNLEMLALASRAQSLFGGADLPIVYECLDIHRLLLRNDFAGRAIRSVEANLGRKVSLVLTSSPAFIEYYFRNRSGIEAPLSLVENKVLALDEAANQVVAQPRPPAPGEPWKIGWFGALRCRKSLALLAAFSRAMKGRFEIVLRGQPAYTEFDDFDGFVRNEPYMTFHGAYQNPEQLAEIYNEVQFTWAIDFFEEGLNSSWLLPNRLYEGCRYGAVPITMNGTETARFVAGKGIGLVLDQPSVLALTTLLGEMSEARYLDEFDRVAAQGIGTWIFDRADCQALVRRIGSVVRPSSSMAQVKSVNEGGLS
ncbi:glycosyl transferase family 1 [Sinorhizobium sp. BG8]|uniref:glycosyl transferase family 1 n=1 Tax=Sinorhizobium sp. BG8 TaxID=2613773 RepID=UPI00193D0F86|nr:glycosyl transferase family 1 [Sinorhizobium sp. BG8]QRM57346.1 glycosyl transferase family 1 [Sinorhizobium sp. BG8]